MIENINTRIQDIKELNSFCEKICSNFDSCEDCIIRKNNIEYRKTEKDKDDNPCHVNLFFYLQEKLKSFILDDINVDVIYTYDEDGDVYFEGCAFDDFEREVYTQVLKYNENTPVYTSRLKNIHVDAELYMYDPDLKYILQLTYEDIQSDIVPKQSISPYYTLLEEKFSKVNVVFTLYKPRVYVDIIIDDLNEESIEAGIKKGKDVYESICSVVENNPTNYDKKLKIHVEKLNDILSEGILRKREEEKRKKKEEEDISYMRKLIEKYGIPEDLLNEEKDKNEKEY